MTVYGMCYHFPTPKQKTSKQNNLVMVNQECCTLQLAWAAIIPAHSVQFTVTSSVYHLPLGWLDRTLGTVDLSFSILMSLDGPLLPFLAAGLLQGFPNRF